MLKSKGKRRYFTLKLRMSEDTLTDLLAQNEITDYGYHTPGGLPCRHYHLPETLSRAVVKQAVKQFPQIMEEMKQSERAFEIMQEYRAKTRHEEVDPEFKAREEALSEQSKAIREAEAALWRERRERESKVLNEKLVEGGITKWYTDDGFSLRRREDEPAVPATAGA